MPCSMTGMGKAVHRGDDYSIEVEVRSVNNRFLLIKSHLPESLMQHEPRLQRVIRKQIRRGTVDLFVRLRRSTRTSAYRLNRKVLEGYMDAIAGMRKKMKLDSPPTPEWLSSLPGVIEVEDHLEISPKVFFQLEQALTEALNRLQQMRTAEGNRLTRAITRCRIQLEKKLHTIEKKTHRSAKDRAQRLRERVEELLGKTSLATDDPSLQREIAILADRADVTEEIDRLKSHLDQFSRIAGSNEI
ncbi:MAG: DUF1732 domain-containing protein, partial [Planctomycetes bacterium]|nr:DUF1732 domain-containing protein [Planctomycetota bacterium]